MVTIDLFDVDNMDGLFFVLATGIEDGEASLSRVDFDYMMERMLNEILIDAIKPSNSGKRPLVFNETDFMTEAKFIW